MKNIGHASITWWKVRSIQMRFLIVSFLAAAVTLVINPIRPGNVQISNPSTAVARVFTEVRLRKLHLARPDLIPYPFAYEVYC